MHRKISLILVAAAACTTGSGRAQDTQCLFDHYKSATVSIEYAFKTKDGEGDGLERGSGFIVSSSGYILTNKHVVRKDVKDAKILSSTIHVRVGGLNADPIPATVEEDNIDYAADLALIKLAPTKERKNWPTLPISYVSTLPVGSPLIGLGFAERRDIAIVPPAQKISETARVDGKPKAWWETSLALSPGNSGGPVFGKLGTVVGVAVAISQASTYHTYVIPIAQAQHLLDKANVRPAATGACADFPSCRHISHGIDRYVVDEHVIEESEWRYGGGNPRASQDAWCSDYLAQLTQRYPASSFTRVRSSEREDFDNALFRVGAKYKYTCEFRRLEGPIPKEAKSVACLK